MANGYTYYNSLMSKLVRKTIVSINFSLNISWVNDRTKQKIITPFAYIYLHTNSQPISVSILLEYVVHHASATIFASSTFAKNTQHELNMMIWQVFF